MKRIFKIVTAFVALILTADSYAQNFSNRGKEFWVGYGHHQYMETSCDGNTQGNNTQDMVLYLSAEQPATVTVTIDSSRKIPGFPNGWTRTYNIPANTVIQTENLPKGSTDAAAANSDPNFDARLFDLPYPLGTGGEGVWRKKGIHIVSNVPIVAYAHIYGGVSSGATMLLPIETWGYSYTSINSEQRDADRSASWVYVIAKDDHTRIRVTPSANSKLGKPAGVPFTVDLMKGQIYQYVATSQCTSGNGPELTGTKIKSIVGADGICHPIAVFSGSSRTGGETLTCGTGSGRDNDMQQAFPEHVWGKRYLTAPFSKASTNTSFQANQFQTSVYKIVTRDAGTTVRINGTAVTISGNVYKFSSNTADYIEADKPIMVSQFMSGTGTCNGGQGDPEMIYLSPIEQGIKNIGFLRNSVEAIGINYLTLVVPTGGLTSLRIDNSQLFSHTYPHPNLPGYTVVVKGWAIPAGTWEQCLVRCDSAFTAITYGLGGAESYGFNAGTYLRNLNAEGEVFNKPDTSGKPRTFTCTGTPMEISALVAYKPTSMNWRLSALGTVVSPNTDVFVNSPTPVDSVTIGVAKYYRYKLPGTYVFSTAGSYDLPIVCTSTDIDNCSLQEVLQIRIEVKPRPSSNFTFTHSGCRTDSVQFNGPSNTGTYAANRWMWNFGDNTVDSIQNPKKGYAATGTYTVSLVAVSAEGCLSDTTRKPVVISPARPASIFANPQNACVGASITFSDTTTITSGAFYWDFGFGTPVTTTSNTPQTITFPAAGTYIVQHTIHPTGNCVSDTVRDTVIVFAPPAKPVAASPFTYCQGSTAAALSATPLAGHTLTWYNSFPLTGGSPNAPTPSTTTAGTFSYYVTQTNSTGCVSDTTKIDVVITPSIAGNTISASQTVCSGSPASTLTGTGTVSGGVAGSYTYQWQQSTNNGATWTNVSGATSATYNPGILSTGTTQFRRVVTSGVCSNTSNVVNIVVETNLLNYEISATQTICEGTAPALLDGQSPTGGTGTYTFQWQSSTDGANWTVIPGAAAEDFQPGVLTVRTYYRRITTGGNCPAISSVVTININPTANGNITGPASICQYNSATATFTATAGTAPYTVQILVTAPGGGTNTITQSITTNTAAITVIPANSAPGTYTVALQSVSDNGNCVRTTGLSNLTINVTATPVITFNPAAPAICAGTPASLTAGGATTYAWSPATGLSSATGATVSANPTATTTYTVTGTTNGCDGTGNVTVTVNPLPAKPVATASTVAYCQNATATPLSATALSGHSLTWYTTFPLSGGSSTAPTPSTANAGTVTYYVTQTNSATNCVSDTTRIVVSVTPAIAGNTISADQTLCAGLAAAPLTGSAVTGGTNTYTYQWQSSADGTTWTTISGATAASYSPGVLPSGTTRFRRIVTSGLCSSTSNVVSVTAETSLSNYEISAAQTVCEGVTPALLVGQQPSGGTGTYTYIWQSSTDGTSWTTIAGATGKDYQPTILSASTYFRRTTSGGNCPATSAPVLITVNPLPNGSITGPAGICSYDNGNIVFTSSAGTAPYTIQLQVTAPGGTSSTISQVINSSAPATINVVPVNSAGGTYTIQLTSISDSKGCTRTSGLASVTIVVTAKPNVTASASSGTICEGTSTTLTASGATSYTWSPSTGLTATTGATISANPTANATYQVIGVTNGCGDTADVSVAVIPRPAKPVATTGVEYCLNEPAVALSATALAGHTLTWYNNASLTGGSTAAPTPSTATAGTYTYYVTQTNSNNCVSDTSAITVTVRPLPAIAFDMPAGVCMPNGTANFINRTTIHGNGTINYNWDMGDNTAAITTRDASHVYAASGSYTVTLTATSSYGCTASLPKTFDAFFEKPEARFTTNRPELCQGQDSYFTDQSNPRGSTITGWWWNFGDGSAPRTAQSPNYKYNRADTFTVQLVVTTAIGCVSDTFKQDVVVHLQPRIDAGPSFVVPEGTTVQFKATANDTNVVSLSWTPPFGLSDPTSLTPTIRVTENRTYTLVAVGNGNCTAMDTMTVRILKPIEVPNAFSPNGDGTNDTWQIPNLADYPGAKVEIFNRWGQQVFLSYGYNRAWDGNFLGKPLPLATYYYVITLNNGFKPITGSVTIIK
jgi:gliding motility-associated-like protein